MRVNENYTDAPPARDDIDIMDGPVLLEFGSSSCGYCRAVQPLLSQAADNVPDIPHIKVGDGSGLPLGRSFQVQLWPTLIFLRDGQEVTRLVRPQSAADIREALDAITETT